MNPLIVWKRLRQFGLRSDFRPGQHWCNAKNTFDFVAEGFIGHHGFVILGPVPVGALAPRTNGRVPFRILRNPFVAAAFTAITHDRDWYSCQRRSSTLRVLYFK